MGSYLVRRDGHWHYARRVPASVMHLDGRGVVRETTKIRIVDDPRGIKARKVAEIINEKTELYWRGLSEGQAAESKIRYDEARRRARSFGFDYLENSKLAERPLEEILARYARLGRSNSEANAAALLGGEQPPKIMLSKLFEEYDTLTSASRRDMSPDQLRKWRNPRVKALKTLIEVIGNKAIADITRDNAIEFQEHWRLRLAHGLEVKTANRDIGVLNKMLNTLDRRHRLGIGKVFSELRIEGEKDKSRTAFAADFVQDRILATGALDELNEEARRVLYLVAETGLRLSEAVNLTTDTIILDAEVPHVRVRPDGRRMKTDQSERDIPLVGVALLAMQAQPNGFPRYRDKGATLSAVANKVLASQGLRPLPGQSAYSLRHTFEDRLTAVEAPEKLIAALMGHKYSRPKYGAGPSLKQKQKWLQRIAFRPPLAV